MEMLLNAPYVQLVTCPMPVVLNVNLVKQVLLAMSLVKCVKAAMLDNTGKVNIKMAPVLFQLHALIAQMVLQPMKGVLNVNLVVLVPMVMGVKIVMLVDTVRVHLKMVEIQIQPIV